jgi:hypothetical protein
MTTDDKTYKTRSSAIRAARQACRKVFGPYYQAFEGPDFYIHPDSSPTLDWFGYRWYFELSPTVREASNS